MIELKNFPTLKDLQSFEPIKLICFDMDGTLFNTEFIHAQALVDIGKALKIKLNLPVEELEKRFHGKADEQVYHELVTMGHKPDVSVEEFVHLKNQLMIPLISAENCTPYFSKELTSFISESKNLGKKLAVVTSSERSVMEALLKCSGIEIYFDFTMTRNEALRIKPDPWTYTETMKYFNIHESETLIFEDSKVGIEAAKASGAKFIFATWWR